MKAWPYERKKSLVGLGFISPWLIGVIWFFLYPMVYAVIYVFYDVSILDNGLGYTFVGGENLRYIFLEDPDNIRLIVSSFLQTLGEVVLIVAFSLFLAILLNQRFRGRAFSRAVFALPILVSSGILLTVFKNDLFLSSVNAGVESTIFQSAALEMSLMRLGLSPALVETVSGIASGILDLIWKAGMQILLFLAGIQSIPGSLYEVCSMEGATAWQTFWKVTFPLTSPFIVLNIIYSIIDAFTYYTNPVMAKAQTYFVQTAYSYNATLVLMYSLFVLALTGLVMAFLSKKVHYVEK